MAEIFGIAAGLVGLASLGLQLPNSISELRDIRHTYKDAPDEIAALITTLEDLRLILESCTITGPSAADDVQEQLLENCKRRCLDIRNSISDVLQPIRAAIQQTPKTAKIKAVFQKKTLEGWLQKLRWSMLELLLAHQIFGRNDTAAQLHNIQQELQRVLQHEQIARQQLPMIEARINHMSTSVQDLLCQSQKVEQVVSVLKDNVNISQPSLQGVKDQIALINDTNTKLLAQQNSFLRNCHEQTIKKELVDFQQLLDGAGSDRAAVFGELRHLNSKLDQLGVSNDTLTMRGSMVEEQETTEFQCLFFKYKYERHGPRLSLPKPRSRTSKSHFETTWLSVRIPSWFLQSQWAVSVAKATCGWQYSLRMYRVLPKDATIFDLCIRGDLMSVRMKVFNGEVSIYDQNEYGHTLLHVAAFAHQAELCEFLVEEGAKPHSLTSVKESPLHEMLYLIPHNPSVSRSLRLFRMLSDLYEDDALASDHSENARRFLEAPSWTPSEHLLFIFKLHQPPRVVENVIVTEAREAAKVQAFRDDLVDMKLSRQGVFLLSVNGPGNIVSVFHLASQRFLEVALRSTAPEVGPFLHWRNLCIDCLRAGYKPHQTIASAVLATPFSASLRRIVNTLYEGKVTWKRTGAILKNCLKHWNLMLLDANVDMQEYVAEEILAWENSRPPASIPDQQTSESTGASHDAHWLIFRGRVGFNAIHDSDSKLKLAAYLKVVDAYHHLEDGEPRAIKGKNRIHSHSRATEISTQHPTEGLHTLHIPGAFPVGRLSEEDGQDNQVIPSQTAKHLSNDDRSDELSNVFDAMEKVSPNAYTAMHDILMDSPEAQTYRKLRLGIKGLSDPSRYDFGHGVTCGCPSCLESRASMRADIRKAYASIYSSDDGRRGGEPPRSHRVSGGGGGGGSKRPRFNVQPQPRDMGNG